MNCPQCQTVNGPDAAFCGSCGARLAPAGASGQPPVPGTSPGYNAPGAPAGYGSPAGYGGPPGNGGPAGYGAPAGNNPPPGYGAPAGSNPPPGYGAPVGNNPPPGYGAPAGNNPPPGYGAPAGNDAPPGYVPPAPGYGPPGGQPPGQYQPGQAGPYVQRSSALPAVSFDLNRLTRVDKIVGVATLITMISLWLPWFSATYSALGITSSGSVSGTGVHGWLWLEFLVALALLAYLTATAAWDRLPFSLPVPHERLLVVATALQFLLVLIGFIAVPSTGGAQGVSVSWDFGAFLALIASIAAAAPVLYPAVKSYLDSRNAASGAQRY
jgi:hypothetical protein